MLVRALWYTQALRDSAVRSTKIGAAPKPQEKVKWREEARAFIEQCIVESDEAARNSSPQKKA